jgi:hypothetical protein
LYSISVFNFLLFQQFLAATSPVSFYLCLCFFNVPSQVQELRYENGATGEQLITRKYRDAGFGYDWEDLLIGRCPTSIVDGNAWLLRMRQKEDEEKKNPRIIMWEPLLG